MDYRPIRELMTRRNGTCPATLQSSAGPELASLDWLFNFRLPRGAPLRPRLKHAIGAVICERYVHVVHAPPISPGRGLTLDEGRQTVALSTRGIAFVTRGTVGRYARIAPTNMLAENYNLDDVGAPINDHGVAQESIIAEDDCSPDAVSTVLPG